MAKEGRLRQENNEISEMNTPDSWSDLYSRCRQIRKNGYSQDGIAEIQLWFHSFYCQCEMYVDALRQHHHTNKENVHTFNEDSEEIIDIKLPRELILQTRFALRFAMACLPPNDSNVRQSMQHRVMESYQWHKVLIQILSLSKGDATIRTSSARLLSNLVTDNARNATAILTLVHLSPSEQTISNRIAETLSETTITDNVSRSNWTDLLLAAAQTGNRATLAAIVATLHNSLLALSEEERPLFTKSIISDKILVSTLLRQMLSVRSIEYHVETDGGAKESQADEATEWLSLLLEQLSEQGYLSAMYMSASGCHDSTGKVLPEHLVLLHCISGAVNEFMSKCPRNGWHPLGGNVLDGIISTHMFLAQQAGQIRQRIVEKETSMDPSELELSKAALNVILGILATSLGDDSSQVLARLRLQIGQETLLIQGIGNDLGTIVDVLSEKNQGVKARELKITDEEQHWITTLIQVLGNLCFRCKLNQDLMRITPVPVAAFLPPVKSERTALHVLLSCTSFSYGCFTLREWSIVALRNVLEGNEENQTLVEQLQAQQPLQNAELEKMGLKIDMDEHGKVKVVPIA